MSEPERIGDILMRLLEDVAKRVEQRDGIGSSREASDAVRDVARELRDVCSERFDGDRS